MLEKNGEDQKDRSCEKRRSIRQSQGEYNIQLTLKRRKNNWTDHMLRSTCLLKNVTGGHVDGRIGGTGKRERRSK